MTASAVIAPSSVSRAHARAVMFAADPPLVSTPPAVGGYPIHRANQSTTSTSSADGPAAATHALDSMSSALAMKSPSTDGNVPQVAMYAR